MIGRTNVGGGGVGNAFAYIGVTYPAGATVTCTDGIKTLRAKDTTGLYVFGVPYAGTWTVTATAGSQTASKNVTISTLWEDKVITLSFNISRVIYNAGDSGWEKDTVGMLPGSYTNGGTATINQYGIEMEIPYGSASNTYCTIRTSSKIDLTGITKLIINQGGYSYIVGNIVAVYVGDYISGNTKATYVGDATVRSSSTTITFNGAQSGSHYFFVALELGSVTSASFGIETMTLRNY